MFYRDKMPIKSNIQNNIRMYEIIVDFKRKEVSMPIESSHWDIFYTHYMHIRLFDCITEIKEAEAEVKGVISDQNVSYVKTFQKLLLDYSLKIIYFIIKIF